MLLDFLTLIIVSFFVIGVVVNKKLILSNQSYINNTFFFASVIYFYISHYYFNDVISLSKNEKDDYKASRHVSEDERERTFARFAKSLSRRVHSFVVEIVLFIYFLFIIFYIIVKTETAKGQKNLDIIFSQTREDVWRFAQTFVISYLFSYVTFYLVKNLFYIKTVTNLVLSIINITLFFVIIGAAYRFVYKNFYKIVGKNKENTDFMNRANVFFGLIESFVFYIPCLIDDIFTTFTQTRNNTTRKMMMVFVIQILILFGYFVVPMINRSVSKYLGNTILDTPLNLDSNYNSNDVILSRFDLEDILTNENGVKNINVNGNEEDIFVIDDKNYGISFWLYLDSQQDTHDKDYTVLNFSNRPHILFNALSKELKIKFEHKDIVVENIPFQKWNHIVINYISGTVDIILNNNIVATKNSATFENTISDVVVGHVNGIPGRVTNVAYFNEPLRGDLINHIYKTNKTATPPRNSGILANSLFLVEKISMQLNNGVSKIDNTISNLDIRNYTPNISETVSSKRAYNALTNYKNNIREYYRYFVDYYIFDYEYDFSGSVNEEFFLGKEKLIVEKKIKDIKAEISLIEIEKAAKNVEMVSNGKKSSDIYTVNKEYQAKINDYKKRLKPLQQKVKQINKKMEKVQLS